MSWRQPERSSAVQEVYATAEADRRADPDRYRLDVDHVVEAAGGPDVAEGFAAGWDEGLPHYLGSADQDGRLNALGVRSVIGTAISRLRSGAALDRHLEQHPEIARRPLQPPIVITGGWRTGTTFLFRLMATDPRLRAPLPSELGRPDRMDGLTGAARTSHIERGASAHERLHFLNPTLRTIHDSGAWLPEECVLAMGHDLRNWGFTSTVRLDSYADWLADTDLSEAYHRYRSTLQTLDLGDGRRWVVKAPAHLPELAHLAKVFPGAVVVHLHRDIVETIASGASLFAVFRSMNSDEVDPADVGRYQAEQTERWLRRAEAFRSTPAAERLTFVDLDYRELVTNPVAAITRVYTAAGLEPPGDPAGFVEGYHDAHPRHAHGGHTYTAAEFGLDENELRARFADLTP
ncbi:MAG: sulfotransferase family protein [Acidimicrobiales bacterium]